MNRVGDETLSSISSICRFLKLSSSTVGLISKSKKRVHRHNTHKMRPFLENFYAVIGKLFIYSIKKFVFRKGMINKTSCIGMKCSKKRVAIKERSYVAKFTFTYSAKVQ